MATSISPSAADKALRTTDERANFQRLVRLLMCGGLALLREVFDTFCTPANLPAVLGNSAIKKQLETLKRKRVLTFNEWQCLYKPSGPGKYGKSVDFDISLLGKLLREICNLTPPATGWDILPNSTDHSLEADLVRIKIYRNEIHGHTPTMGIKDAEFGKLWMEIKEALLRIASSISRTKSDEWKKAIEESFHEPLTPDAKKCVEDLKSWYLMDMETKEKLEKVDENTQQVQINQEQSQKTLEQIQKKIEQYEIIHEERHMEILVYFESLKAGWPSVRSSPQMDGAQLPSEGVETRIPMPPDHPPVEGTAGPSTDTELQAREQNLPVVLDFWYVVYSFKRPLELLIKYLKIKLGVDVQSYRLGSLVITVSCSSLEALESLWRDYRTGHLNEVVQDTLVTAEVLEKLELSEVKLRTVISEENYLSYKDFLKNRSGKIKYIQVALTSHCLRDSLPKSGPLDFAKKNTFPLFFVGEEALVGIY